MAESLLIVEDEETLSESLKRVFQREGYDADACNDAESAIKNVAQKSYDLIITDIVLPGMTGIELLKKYKEQNPDQIVIIMTANASLETAIEALRAGAYDYVMKPIIHDEIKRTVRNALIQKALKTENLLLKRQIGDKYDFGRIVGRSSSLTSVINEVKKIADSKSNVLLLGETGTGKELFARAIHFNSLRRDKPFVPINCSAIPENLLESELFGYIRGAFTGAVTSKRGLFEEADGGTVFLDEIGDLTHPLQAKLLRVMDDYEIRPLGGVHSRKIDIRFICATNKDIAKSVREKSFREDLYYRVNVVTLTLPPLRERDEDIVLLARHFIERLSKEIGKNVKYIDEAALGLLVGYDWPGNVRELQNIIERAVLITEGSTIFPRHLPERFSSVDSFTAESLGEKLSIESYTKALIIRYQQNNTEKKLAEILGITRKALWEKRKRWGIPRK